MGSVDPFKVTSPGSMICYEIFRFNTNYVNIYLPKIILFIPLVESFTRHSQVTIFFALNSGNIKYILTLILVARLTAWVLNCITYSSLAIY